MSSVKTDTWYPRFPADYVKDTLLLTLEEDGFYSRALDQVYLCRGKIPADPIRLRLLLRVDQDQWSRCAWLLEKYFYRDGESYGNSRADREIARAQENARKAQENGKKGGRPVRTNPGKTESVPALKPTDIPDGTQTVSAAKPSWNPDPNPEKSSPPPPPSSREIESARAKTPKEIYWDFLVNLFQLEIAASRDELRLYEQCAEFAQRGATLEEIRIRAIRYREKHADMPFTVNAVLNNWDALKLPPSFAPARNRL